MVSRRYRQEQHNSQRLPKINAFWNLDAIKQKVEASPHGNWAATYVCAMTLITEAVRTIVAEYGYLMSAAGYDSNVYLEHFKMIKPVSTGDYDIVT